MDSPSSQHSRPESLAQLLGVGRDEQLLWTAEDLAALWRHQMSASLQFDLAQFDPHVGELLARLSPPGQPPINTFGEMLAHPRPPLELLELVKDFAESNRGPTAALPSDIAAMLYVLCIATAQVRLGQRITELDDEALARQIHWALGQDWIDSAASGLLSQCRQALATTRGMGDSDLSAPTCDNLAPATPQPGSPHASSPQPDVSLPDLPALGQLGEYRLLRKLGEGGMGVVYQALHVELDRVVAIKVLRSDRIADEEVVARFRREIKAAGRFDHPNIVRALDARKIGQHQLLVMEYVDGVNLHQLVHQVGPLPVAEACELVRQAALGLDCAHQNQLVHRDVKPSNLILTRGGVVKVLDLGLARFALAQEADGMTVCGTVMGTPDYMSPEQAAESHLADIRSDIYSLGCVLYKLLTGRAPFEDSAHRTAMSKMAAQIHEPVPPPSALRSDLPAGLLASLDRMLAKSPDKRYASPAEVVAALVPLSRRADLHALLVRAGMSEEGQSPTKKLHVQPTSARRRWPWVAVATLGVMLAAATVMHLGRTPDRDPGEPTTPAVSTAATAVAPAVNPNSSSLAGWIVLSWTRPKMGKSDLWLFRPDGRKRINLTNDPRSFHIHPHFSPDGRQIAFVRGADALGPNSVCVCRADGTQMRALVDARDGKERFASPVWVSESRLYYARDPRPDRDPDMEVWQVDLSGGDPQRVFQFKAALQQGGGVVTDVSPDAQQLAIIAQNDSMWATGDVLITDLQGHPLQSIWEDRPDQLKDGRALWSSDGRWLAWHHNFKAGGLFQRNIPYGVGLAERGPDGRFSGRLQPQTDTTVTPLAWSPQGDRLLCARMAATGSQSGSVTLFLMDTNFGQDQELFELEGTYWQPGHRDFARLGDWAIIPADVTPAAHEPVAAHATPGADRTD